MYFILFTKLYRRVNGIRRYTQGYVAVLSAPAPRGTCVCGNAEGRQATPAGATSQLALNTQNTGENAVSRARHKYVHAT